MKFVFAVLFVTLFLSSLVMAHEDNYNHEDTIALLTVSGPNNTIGGVASVKLEIHEGTGRVFIDSYPLSQLDTQISTRFAKEVSCDFLEVDCSNIDFFYTIRTNSGVIGGPSAGAALAVLTTALLDDQTLNKNIAMTGTINSGGTIGAVGGIPAKVSAAQDKGFEKVLIPKFAATNLTQLNSIEVIEVTNLAEVLEIFTGKSYRTEAVIEETEEYTALMRSVSEEICSRTDDFFATDIDEETDGYNLSLFFHNLSQEALKENDYYSAASFCFSANIRLRDETLQNSNNLNSQLNDLKEKIETFDKKLEERKLDSLPELETYMIVKERILEAEQIVEEIDEENISTSRLGYGIERYNSAVSWSKFFALEGREINLDSEHLRQACLNKIEEAEERVSYVRVILPVFRNQEIQNAKESRDEGNWGLCLFQATKAKAEINSVIDASATSRNQTENLVDSKLELAEQVIAKQQEKEQFPILGYSYYQYSSSLNGQDTTNALIFAEYALEFSNLDTYFPQDLDEPAVFGDLRDGSNNAPFIYGLVVGLLIALVLIKIIIPGNRSPKKATPRKKR